MKRNPVPKKRPRRTPVPKKKGSMGGVGPVCIFCKSNEEPWNKIHSTGYLLFRDGQFYGNFRGVCHQKCIEAARAKLEKALDDDEERVLG